MNPKLRLTLSADAPQKLAIAIHRTDVVAGEPHALQTFHELQPGESIVLPVHERSLITIAEQTAIAPPSEG